MLIVMIPLMIAAGIFTHITARHSVARQTAAQAENPQTAIMNKLMLYVFPIGVVVGAPFLPLAVLLYWVANNLWTLGQQYVVYRQIDAEESGEEGRRRWPPSRRGRRGPGRSRSARSQRRAGRRRPSRPREARHAAAGRRKPAGTAQGRRPGGRTARRRKAARPTKRRRADGTGAQPAAEPTTQRRHPKHERARQATHERRARAAARQLAAAGTARAASAADHEPSALACAASRCGAPGDRAAAPYGEEAQRAEDGAGRGHGEAAVASNAEDQLVREGDIAGDYLERLLDLLDYDGDIDLDVEAGRAVVSIDGGEDLDKLVGDRGTVLEALQELTRLAVQQSTGTRSRLMLDIAGWRQARRTELTELGTAHREGACSSPASRCGCAR